MEARRLARTELERQLESTTHDRRRTQLTQAIADINKKTEALKTRVG